MSGQRRTGPEAGRAPRASGAVASEAARWVVRLHAAEAGEAEWLAFESWLASSAGARAAYDEAATLWRLAGEIGVRDVQDQDDQRGRRIRASLSARTGSRLGGMAALGLGGLSVAMTAVLFIVLGHGQLAMTPKRPPAPMVYTAARGAPRTVVLADGTRMVLAGGSLVAVRFEARARHVAMSRGEVAFTVAHDAARPFTVAIGDREVRDIGTEFDIRRDGRQIRVTVREGKVEVSARDPSAAAAAPPVALAAGQQLRHDEETGASSVASVSADEVFAWKQDRLIYRDQPLKVVVEDLNRRFPHALRIEGERTAGLRFTGVLAVDAEAATIRRLTELLPIEADRINGETVLRARAETR
jgi:transmembrane sensor